MYGAELKNKKIEHSDRKREKKRGKVWPKKSTTSTTAMNHNNFYAFANDFFLCVLNSTIKDVM